MIVCALRWQAAAALAALAVAAAVAITHWHGVVHAAEITFWVVLAATAPGAYLAARWSVAIQQRRADAGACLSCRFPCQGVPVGLPPGRAGAGLLMRPAAPPAAPGSLSGRENADVHGVLVHPHLQAPGAGRPALDWEVPAARD
jgi:hypothetical protein